MGQGVAMGKGQVLAAFGLGELKEVGLSAFPTAFGLGGLKVLLEASSWCYNISDRSQSVACSPQDQEPWRQGLRDRGLYFSLLGEKPPYKKLGPFYKKFNSGPLL